MSLPETLTAGALSAVCPPLRFFGRWAGVHAARVPWLGLEVVRTGCSVGQNQCGALLVFLPVPSECKHVR